MRFIKYNMISVFLFYSAQSLSNNDFNIVPDQFININLNYDPLLDLLYNEKASGSDYIVTEKLNDFELKVSHGRDGYIGVRQLNYNQGTGGAVWLQIRRNTGSEIPSFHISNPNGKQSTVDTYLGNSSIRYYTSEHNAGSGNSNGCNISGLSENVLNTVVVTKTSSPYSSDSCFSGSYWSRAGFFSNDVTEVGFKERFFRFNRNELRKLPFGEYTGKLVSVNSDVISIRGRLGREAYTYTVNLNVKTSVNSFNVDNDNVEFSVNKQSNQIIGKAQTGFNVRGSFHNSQAFDMTFTSLNNARCGGALCLSNTEANTQIPYQVRVLDPSTLQEKPVTRSGQKVTIYADKDFQLSGGLFFEFESENTALSGTFNDVVTVRAELKII
ncbi:hypothetical protein V6448_001752 [Vibrio vulnificus]|nr:hypothetical protein [Vibrio vulnificus]